MAAGMQTIQFQNPLDPIGQALALQQVQRLQDQADALSKQSMDAPPDNGGNVSWTQGIAKIAQALAANHLRRSAMGQAWDATTQGADASRGTFNLPPIYAGKPNPYSTDETGRNLGQRVGDFFTGGPPVHPGVAKVAAAQGAPSPAGTPPQPQGTTTTPSFLPGTPTAAMPATPPDVTPVGTVAVPPSAANVAKVAAALAPPAIAPGGSPGFADRMQSSINGPAEAGSPIPSAMPVIPAPAPGPYSNTRATTHLPANPNVLPGMTPEQSYNLMVTQPQVYAHLREAAGTPTDAVKNLIAQGLQPGTPEFADALGKINRKAGFIDPTMLREGGTALDNNTPGAPAIYAPHVPAGYEPSRGPDNRLLGIVPTAGGPEAVAGSAAAVASGKGAGGAPYETVPSFNPATNTPTTIPKSTALGMPGGNPTGPALGASAAAGTAGTNSANSFNALIQSGQGAKDLSFTLGRLGDIAKTLPGTGAGYESINTFKSKINTTLQSAGKAPWFDNNGIANAQEIQKYVAQIAQQQSALGGGKNGSTDARLAAAFASLADVNKAPAAIQAIVSYGQGVAAAGLGHSQAGAAWLQTHGPESYPQFSVAWQRAYDPRIYQWMQGGPANVANNVRTLPKPDQAKLLDQYRALKAMGAIQ